MDEKSVPISPEQKKHKGGAFGRRVPGRLLTDMRWVYRHPEKLPRNEARRALQELFHGDFPKFIGELNKLEAQFRGPKLAATTSLPHEKGEATARGSDPGTERVEDLIRQLLDEAKGSR